MSLIQVAVVTNGYVRLKFAVTVAVSTLVNGNFTLYNTHATPSIVSDPFKTIDLQRDYDSIARILNLYFSDQLEASALYRLVVQDLYTPTDILIPLEEVIFTTSESTEIPEEDVVTLDENIYVEDHSIKDIGTVANVSDLIIDGKSEFYIQGIKPDLDTHHFLSEDYNEGKIEITFNHTPAANFISSEYFKVQRKAINQGMSRWLDVSALVTSDPSTNRVVIFLPSNDATPIYSEYGKVYWETGFKYRVRISSAIGI